MRVLNINILTTLGDEKAELKIYLFTLHVNAELDLLAYL